MTRRPIAAASFLAVAGALAATPAQADDPTTSDCLTANTNGVHLHNQHKLRDARQQFLVCASQTCPPDIRTDCAGHVAEVNTAIPTIVFEVKDATGADLTAVKISMDGQPLVDHIEGTAISLDPGEHRFTFEAPGLPRLDKTFVIVEAMKDRRERITIGPASAPTPPPASPAPPLVAPATAAPPAPERPAPPPPSDQESTTAGNTQRTWGLVAGGVGVAALAAGGIFGVLAVGAKNGYEQHCGSNIGQPPGSCDSQGISGHSDASTKATISTALVIGGAALAAGGAVLFFTAPRGATAPQVGIGPGGLVLRGGF